MKVVLFASGRGGQSKTNIAYSLSHISNQLKIKTTLIDTDTNAALHQKINDRILFEESGVISNKIDYNHGHMSFSGDANKTSDQIAEEIMGFAGDSDLLVIDTFGHLSKMHKDLLQIVDLVVIPTVPESSAVRAALQAYSIIQTELKRLIDEHEDIEEDELPSVCMVRTRWKGKMARVHDQELSAGSIEHGYKLLNSYTTEYSAQYGNADYLGLPITELPDVLSGKEKEAAEKAAIQMKVLAKEILREVRL